ncbi:MAG: hypothetical protein WAU70_11735 [Flavobacteriales bacterium]
MRQHFLISAFLIVAPAHALIEEVLHLDFDNGQWDPNWYYAGDVPTFEIFDGVTLGLVVKHTQLHAWPIAQPPGYALIFIPVPGGYLPDHAYELEAKCFPAQGYGWASETGVARLGWYDYGTGITYAPQFLSFGNTITQLTAFWDLGGPASGTGTFGVFLTVPDPNLGPAVAAKFDDVIVRSKPYGASADGVRFFLGGAYEPGVGSMRYNLRALGLIPLVEPYTAMGFPQIAGGGEVAAPNWLNMISFVDWVRLELRDPNDPTQLVASGQFLLWSNGKPRLAESGGDVIFNAAPGNYYLVVCHRNHLPIMTAAPVYLAANTANPTSVDFRLPGTATYGTDAQRNINGTMVLWAGDVTGNARIKYTGANNDRDPILLAVGGIPTATLSGQYRMEDVNMDGIVKYTGLNNDRDPILVNVGGTTPTAVRIAQVP